MTLLAPVEGFLYEGHEGDASHIVPPDLLEWYEILEFNGLIETPAIPLGAPRRAATPIPGTVISRAQWGARAPTQAYTAITSKRGSTAHYEGPHLGDFPHESCATKVRGIQSFHMDQRGWIDIAYSTLTCPHGEIFMCRGNARTAANGTNEGNATHFAHCVLMGVDDPLTSAAKFALRAAFRIARDSWGAGAEEKVHSDWKATACPGDPVRQFVRSGMGVEPTPTPTDNFKERVMAKAVLRQGSSGHDVRILQGLLIAHGAVLASEIATFVDGDFGTHTAMRLGAWQKKTGVLDKYEFGFCGPRTWAWLVNV